MLQQFETQIGIRSEQDVTFGFECAGVVTKVGPGVTEYQPGDRVLALSTASLGSHLTVDRRYVASIPSDWTLEQAATVPLAYLTAWYGLSRLARLKRGERVLIHAAAGGVGQAAVAIAQSIGGEIFATASRGKHEFLRTGNSTRLRFANHGLCGTDSHGHEGMWSRRRPEQSEPGFHSGLRSRIGTRWAFCRDREDRHLEC